MELQSSEELASESSENSRTFVELQSSVEELTPVAEQSQVDLNTEVNM